MPTAFSTICFTKSVKAAQTRYGSRENNLRLEISDDPKNQLSSNANVSSHNPFANLKNLLETKK